MVLVRLKEFDMNYKEIGQGFPIICIMGLGANLDYWGEPLIQKLAQQHRVILLDNRGAGQSTGSHLPITIPLMAQDILHLMDALGIERSHVFGVSMGGMIAQELALQSPTRIQKLVLACSGCGSWHMSMSPVLLWKLVQKDNGKKLESVLFPNEFQRQYADRIAPFSERTKRHPTDPKVFIKQLRACATYRSKSRLGMIQAPTLVLTGDQDILVPMANSRMLARGIPGAKLKIYEGCGHGFMLQAGAEFEDELLDFLQAR